jgi:hypothetical protein
MYAQFIADVMNRMTAQAYMRAYTHGIALTLDAAVNEARLPI